MSEKLKELFYQCLELQIEELVDKLNPKLKGKFSIMSMREGSLSAAAKCSHLVNPPLITVNLNSIVKNIESQGEMEKLLSHEIIHALQTPANMENWQFKENEAYYKQDKISFFV